jgi:nucleoside-diphosphate-sugar epimerase
MILITGATGLTGSHLLLQLLESGKKVRAIYRTKETISAAKSLFAFYKKNELLDEVEWVQANVNDIPALEKAFKGVDYVYHCAALISFDPADEEKLRKANIEGTANIVNCCLDFQVKKLVHVSSIAALGDRLDSQDFVDEENEWNPEKPHSDYAISKHGAEMEVWRAQQEGLNVVVVNPGIIIGPPFWTTGSSAMYEMIRNGQRFYTLGTMGFVSAKDVAKIMELLMNSDISGQRFTLSAADYSYRDIFDMAADALHKKRPSSYAKPWMTSIGWRIDWFLSLFGKKRMITSDQARSLHETTKYPAKKIADALDYHFQSIDKVFKEIFPD